MLKLLNIEDYHLIPIEKKWFKGKIYVDKRAKILPFQIDILERFISEIIDKSSKVKKIKLDFHILITSDPNGVEFSVDVFAFIDEMVVDDQNTFNNAFSSMHWGLSSILSTISQLCEGLLGRIPIEYLDDPQGHHQEIEYQQESIPGEFKPEEKETIH